MKLTLALILGQWSAGMLGGLALVRRLHPIGPGFTWLIAGAVMGTSALTAIAGEVVAGSLLFSIAAAMLSFSRRRYLPIDMLAILQSVVVSFILGGRAGDGWEPMARTVAGAAFLGLATVAMTVGHWYLIDPKLPRTVIRRIDLAFLAAALAEAVVLLVPDGMLQELRDSPRAGVNASLPPFWIALTALTVVLGVAVLGALREKGYPAVMAATGLLYLAVITAFGVDILGKALISGSL